MKYIILVALLIIAGNASAQTASGRTIPENGYVPDATTAVAIAEAVLRPLYGKNIGQALPVVATLERDSIWVVRKPYQKGRKGGPYVEISKSDGRILVAELGK